MDFDDKKVGQLDSFNNRMDKFDEIVPSEYKDRVFLLGVNYKESESLKKVFGESNFEEIGKILIQNYPNCSQNWNNIHLECNIDELKRMEKNGVYKWLFNKG